ncbi:nuclear protein MDM1 isoform X1 [Solea senegalensis]|uniref:Nuclear protein MDM1 n=1 Tax=Solea senegalensis TaxID=28829 RepID=A0AAV6PLV5_SOLSE|nr:nuclear protein MDM1 isoform X1 [Solea senegalensis]KAG7466729.1 nuclear protein MDM1 isoform X1 [Solea senegalensis]
MTVRFKGRSEYQRSFGVSRSRSASPHRCHPVAGLRSDQNCISREPGLQRRRKLNLHGLTRSCSSLLGPSQLQRPLLEPTDAAHRNGPSAPRDDDKPSNRHSTSLQTAPPAPPAPPAEPEAPVQLETPAGPRPTMEAEPGSAGKSAKPRPTQPDRQSQPGRPLTSAAPDEQRPSASQEERALRWRAGLRSAGQRSEYHRQYSSKKPVTSASPLLSAEKVMYSSSRAVPPFKKSTVPMETEYRRSFQGVAPPTGPRLRKHLEYQRIPLFHTYMINKKRREESHKKHRPADDVTSPPLQVQRRRRKLTEYQSSFHSPPDRTPEKGGATDGHTPQVTALRRQASSYRCRAWGANFSRGHLGQLRSQQNALWEPEDATDSDPTSPRLTFDLSQEPDSHSLPCVEALDLHSGSSKRSSVAGSGEINNNTNKNMQTKAQTPVSPPAERHTAWEEEEEEEEEDTDEEEGRLPTPALKMRPVQRTHHDLTTPTTAGGAILVGKQRCGSAVSMATWPDPAVRKIEAWPENDHSLCPSPGPSPDHKLALKPVRVKQTPPPPVAPPPLVTPALHGIQGKLRSADFQHNGDLGLRFRERPCSGGAFVSDEDDRLSVMSWRSAASFSAASGVLERALKRRENFWGKR